MIRGVFLYLQGDKGGLLWPASRKSLLPSLSKGGIPLFEKGGGGGF
jgi:hypothetical protein